MKIHIAFITVNRSDYGIWRSILSFLLKQNDELKITLFVTGTHFDPSFGHSINEIKNDKLYHNLIEIVPATPYSPISAISQTNQELGEALKNENYDCICILGDRFEALGAAVTASVSKIPIIHFHGGAITEGAFDDSFRHAITKLANYHMVETAQYKKRLMQLGEASPKIRIVGAPSLCHPTVKRSSKKDFLKKLKLPNLDNFVLATLHSETYETVKYNRELAYNFLSALVNLKLPTIITAPNPDPGFEAISEQISEFTRKYPELIFFRAHLGHELYWQALKKCSFIAGNSSSGIIEACTAKKLALDIGKRQARRARDWNVRNCRNNYNSIYSALSSINKQSSSKIENKNFKKASMGPKILEKYFMNSLNRAT